ncbi:hypothetical protein [Cupriavidus taiwanensis]|uniref:hypothetical protein n=1 Tax=Cupriavidus taiwanensis TaxID=164546 RepID=UPI000E1A7305|nr:hypothetical protein [Cupriavidus taiwanensis]SPA44826.1 conserved hypothetical protein [Cupriavidus taiwanensis]
MATNDFLVFGGGAGANVITQVTYSGLAARTAGFSSGVAQSAQLNKVWRQSSIMAAVLAQFIGDISGQDVLDDGSTTAILTNLKAASRAQSIGIVGAVRNARMSVAAASAIATFSADEVVVETALGGLVYRLPNFSKTVNLATVGAGGMDTGTAPANGYVALYAIYNPTTGASALLAKDATSGVQPEVYGAANMPAGYTASALVSVLRTNGSSQLTACFQVDRAIYIGTLTALTTSTVSGAFTSFAISSIVPPNAKAITAGSVQAGSSATSTVAVSVAGSSVGFGAISASFATNSAQAYTVPMPRIALLTPQTLYYSASNTAGTPTYVINISGYEF